MKSGFPALFLIWLGAIFGGACLGLLTNAINGRVSPAYFVEIMRWENVADVPRAAIAQGAFEGLVMGLTMGTIFVVAIGLISGARCSATGGLKFLGGLFLSAMALWTLGGLLAVGLATLSPEFYRETFRGVPEGTGAISRYAWVGGSIWGIQFGTVAMLILWIVIFRTRWRAGS